MAKHRKTAGAIPSATDRREQKIWTIEVAISAQKDLVRLDSQTAARLRKYLERISHLDDPRSLGEALHGSKFGELWRYRVGDYRLVCEIQDDRLVVIVVRVGHRKEIYKRL